MCDCLPRLTNVYRERENADACLWGSIRTNRCLKPLLSSLTTVSDLLGRVIGYLPNVFVAILVLLLGTFAATMVADVVRGSMGNAKMGNPSLFANIARYAILGFVALIALEQLGIAPALLNILFTAVVGAAALAAALAFGLGGQETARKYLARTESAASQVAMQVQQNGTQTSAQTLPQPTRNVPRTR